MLLWPWNVLGHCDAEDPKRRLQTCPSQVDTCGGLMSAGGGACHRKSISLRVTRLWLLTLVLSVPEVLLSLSAAFTYSSGVFK